MVPRRLGCPESQFRRVALKIPVRPGPGHHISGTSIRFLVPQQLPIAVTLSRRMLTSKQISDATSTHCLSAIVALVVIEIVLGAGR